MTTSEWDIDPRPTSLTGDAVDAVDDDWYIVRGTSERTRVAGDIVVRVGKAVDGRLILTGLMLTGDREITANTLRAVQIAKIVQTIAWREEGGEPPRSVGPAIGPTGMHRFEGVAMEFEAIVANASVVSEESKRGRRGPTSDDIEQFARVYLAHRRAGRQNPVKRTMDDLHIGSRATAHRRIDQARALGLIPPRKEDR